MDTPFPWEIPWSHPDTPEIKEAVSDVSVASAIAFALWRLKPGEYPSLARRAERFLLEAQTKVGAWAGIGGYITPPVENEPQFTHDPSVLHTSMAIHALRARRPDGWQAVVEPAADWLWLQQSPFGCWVQSGWPQTHVDPTFLTVLVLDALELARGGTRVTFHHRELVQPPDTKKDEPGRKPHVTPEARRDIRQQFDATPDAEDWRALCSRLARQYDVKPGTIDRVANRHKPYEK